MQQRPQSEQAESTGAAQIGKLLAGLLIHTLLLIAVLFHAPIFLSHLGYAQTQLGAVYALSGIFMLLMGSIPAVMLLSSGFKRYLGISVMESSIIAVIASVNTVQFQALQRLTAIEDDLGFGRMPAAPMDPAAVPQPHLLFAVLLTSFNIPFLYAYTQRSDVDWRYLAFYSIPVLLYGVLVIVFDAFVLAALQ